MGGRRVDHAAVIELRKQGKTHKEIAIALGLKSHRTSAIARTLKQAGLVNPPPPKIQPGEPDVPRRCL